MQTETTVQAIAHTDVRGKELKYIKITKGTKDVLINVGDKTYKSVCELTNQGVYELTNQEEKKPKVRK